MITRRKQLTASICLAVGLIAVASFGVTLAQQQKGKSQQSAKRIAELSERYWDSTGELASSKLDALATVAAGTDQNAADAAIAQLRAAGQAGLDAMFRVHGDVIDSVRSGENVAFPFAPDVWATPERSRVKAALEAVSRQYDVHASCLFWHTDIEDAKSEAIETGKPILSLRLLGNLDEECSCANSRFFRTALYANQEVSQYLRDNFVLHWKSVRPVPKITIDFGDGQVMERTITGNSIHYVLTPSGKVVDALPGLYGPQAFMANLTYIKEFAQNLEQNPAELQQEMFRLYHADSTRRLVSQMESDLAEIAAQREAAAQTDAAAIVEAAVSSAAEEEVNAASANNRTAGKMVVEAPLLNAMAITEEKMRENAELAGTIDSQTWAEIAALHSDEVRLDSSSVALMREHRPTAAAASALAISKSRVEDPMVRMVTSFERSIAEDTVRNEYTFRRQIHEWFASDNASNEDVDLLNERVYAELFLTPSTDPWLGLMPSEYSALRADGVQLRMPETGTVNEEQ